MTDIVVVGDWTDIHQGHCLEFEHRHNRNCSIKYPSSVLRDLDSFADLLQQNPPKSLQLTSEDNVTLEDFYHLLTVIGENCKELECLGINFNMDECNLDVDKTTIDLELEEVIDLEPLTLPQRTCVQAWLAFIEAVAAKFHHISIVGDLSIPYFAIQTIIKTCPNFTYIGGGYSSKAGVTSTDQLREVTDESTDYIVFLHVLFFEDFDLGSISGKFNNLRVLYFDWNSSMDLGVLEDPAMTNLIELFIVNPSISDESSSESSLTLTVPMVDIFLPENSQLTELALTGLDLNRTSWEKFGERTKLLKRIYIIKGGIFEPEYIEITANLPRLEVLQIEASNSATGKDIIPLLILPEEGTRFQLRLDLKKNNICSNRDIEKTVLQILECMQNITDETIEGKVGVTIEYWHHVGGFEFLKEAVEKKGFTFERDPDEESKIWNCNLSDGNSSDRFVCLVEEKAKQKCDDVCEG